MIATEKKCRCTQKAHFFPLPSVGLVWCAMSCHELIENFLPCYFPFVFMFFLSLRILFFYIHTYTHIYIYIYTHALHHSRKTVYLVRYFLVYAFSFRAFFLYLKKKEQREKDIFFCKFWLQCCIVLCFVPSLSFF